MIALAEVVAVLREAYKSRDDVVGRYFTPNARFRVGNYETRISSLLMDVYTVPQR